MLTRTPTHRVTISLHLVCKGISSGPCHGWYFNTSPWGFHEVTSEIHNPFEIFLWRSFWTSTQNASPYPTLHMISRPLGGFHFFDVWGNTKPHTIHCCVEWKCWILDVTDFYSAWFASIIHILHACSPRSEVVIVSDFPSFSNLGDFDVPSVSVDLVALASPVL